MSIDDARLLKAPPGSLLKRTQADDEYRIFKKHDLGFWFPVRQWRQGWLQDYEIPDYPFLEYPKGW
ncbi:MAG: hypothetical protein WAN89_02820 [Lawsonella sp.]